MDCYFSSPSYDALAGMLTQTNGTFHVKYSLVIGPHMGKEATSTVNEDGSTTVTEAVGDPSLWYVGVRVEEEIEPDNGVSVCDPDIGRAVLGTWA